MPGPLFVNDKVFEKWAQGCGNGQRVVSSAFCSLKIFNTHEKLAWLVCAAFAFALRVC